jgi:hypothetical protein
MCYYMPSIADLDFTEPSPSPSCLARKNGLAAASHNKRFLDGWSSSELRYKERVIFRREI